MQWWFKQSKASRPTGAINGQLQCDCSTIGLTDHMGIRNFEMLKQYIYIVGNRSSSVQPGPGYYPHSRGDGNG